MSFDLATVDPAWAWQPFVPTAERPWNRRLAAHLFRRAGFSASSTELDAAVKRGPVELVQSLVTDARAAAEAADSTPDELAQAMLATGDARRLSSWWLHRMLTTPHPLLEKLTLFWHGLFATSAAKVTDPHLMFDQNRLLRREALGSFGQMVREMSRNAAMLLWLDSATNRKAHPNENYAREVMELFCLGEGNYSERDVQELARCFTGWEVKRNEFRFNRFQHDSGEKTILGRTGKFGGEEGVAVVLEQPTVERFIARRLVRFLVMDEPEASDRLIEPLARTFRESGLNVAALVRQILSSNLFFSEAALARRVRSPVELGVGLLRSFEASADMYDLAEALNELGQAVFFPPNVKGWDGGRAWINTSTLLGRANVVGALLRHERTRFAGGSLAAVIERHAPASGPKLIVWLEELLLAVTLPDATRSRLVRLLEEQPGSRNDKLAAVVHALGTLPEFQLC